MIQASNKEAINIAINFFKGNINLSLITLTILAILSLLKVIPFIGLISSLLYSILGFSIQIYLIHQISNINRSEEMREIALQTRLKDMLTNYLDVATGGFLGIFFIFILLGTLFIAFLSTQMNLNTLSNSNIQLFIQTFNNLPNSLIISLTLLVIMSFLGYIFPAVIGEMMMAKDFKEAFNKTFLLFKPNFWQRTFTKSYFKLIMLWTGILFVAVIIISLLSKMLLLLPVVFVLIYIVLLYNASIYLFSRELIKSSN